MDLIIKNKTIQIDKEDFEKISTRKWHISTNKAGQTYFQSWFKINCVWTKKLLHRFITDAPKGFFVDHKDHDTLNNRKNNLRICTNSQNQQNQSIRKGGTSKYKGVYYNKRDKLFYSNIRYNGEKIYIGSFKNENDAAIAYNKKAIEKHGEFASINTIEAVK